VNEKTEICYTCHWLVVQPGGFFQRKNPKDHKFPCDQCLGKMTTFQQADKKRIWLRYIPIKEKQKLNIQKQEKKKVKEK